MITVSPPSRPSVRSPERAWRLAYLRTLHDLRRSAALHRPISLPNLWRLYRRRVAALGLRRDAAAREREALGLRQLTGSCRRAGRE